MYGKRLKGPTLGSRLPKKAMNLAKYDAMEPRRFVGYYQQMAPGSAVRLARADSATITVIASR